MKQERQYKHGGEIYDKDIALDYSINVNPFGMPESVKRAIVAHMEEYTKYPDDSCIALRKAIAKAHHTEDHQKEGHQSEQVNPEMVLCGNGAADIIYRLCLAEKPKRAMVLAPTFSEYEEALRMVDCTVEYYDLKEETGFTVEDDIFSQIRGNGYNMIFLCNPNNPVGNLIAPERMEQIIAICKEEGIRLVVDECFMEFTMYLTSHSVVAHLPSQPHVIVIKAFTKTYAMAGLRLGYALSADASLLARMRASGPPWAVSTTAQVAGLAALGEAGYVERARAYLVEGRAYLAEELRKMGYEVYDSCTNYLLFREQGQRAKQESVTSPIGSLYERMLARKILLRQCGNYRGLGEDYYRITIGLEKDNHELIQALWKEQ